MEQATVRRPPHPWATQTPGDVRQTEDRLMLNPTQQQVWLRATAPVHR